MFIGAADKSRERHALKAEGVGYSCKFCLRTRLRNLGLRLGLRIASRLCIIISVSVIRVFSKTNHKNNQIVWNCTGGAEKEVDARGLNLIAKRTIPNLHFIGRECFEICHGIN